MNPYKILGVPEGSDKETIKKAYHALVKKYHPDKYADNPLKELAEEKLKEINKAYDMLMGDNGGQNTYSQSSYGGSSGSYGTVRYDDVRNLINMGRVDEALNLLETKNRGTAEYNYLKGMIYLRRGWFGEAVRFIDMAASMEPSNAEYQYAKNNLRNRAGGYRSAGGGMADADMCNCCSNLICADCCCEMCGGDLISCC